MLVLLFALACGADLPLNDKVVEYAKSMIGEQVGDGECSTLAAFALRHAGCRPKSQRNGVWGVEIESAREIRAGDIVQFEKASFVTSHFRDDGAFITETLDFPHHTAVIVRVRKRGRKPTFVILHQNVGGSRIVQEGTIDLGSLRRGSVKYYRPTAPE
jgi:hypothetical protein